MPNKKHSVFARPKLTAQAKRNPFDLSHKRAFHASLGEILPVFHMEVPAGAYVEINETNQTYNMNPLVRPAFSRIKEHIDYFAIPKVQLWSFYDNFITGQSQYMSSSLMGTTIQDFGREIVPQEVPTITGEVLIDLLTMAYGQSNPFGVNESLGSIKLLDLLGYGNFHHYVQAAGSAEEFKQLLQEAGLANMIPVNLFNLLAFQKVYYSYYRNSQYEDNCVEAFNIDWIKPENTSLTDDAFLERLFPIIRPHFRWLKKDYFTSVKPSVLATSADIGFNGLKDALQESMAGSLGTQNTNWQVFGIPGLGQRNIFPGSLTSPSNNSGNAVKFGNQVNTSSGATQGSETNVSALRFAFAYDKLLRRMREAGATFDDQMLAQFGIKPVDQRHGDAFWLGGFTNRLNINEVTQTGLGQDITALGQFGANISKFSANNETISYHAKEDCIILGIYSTSYDADYPSSRVERDNIRRYRFDYFNPAFQDLGCQPLYRGEMSNIDLTQTDGEYGIALASEQVKLLGYVKRYLDYKTKVDTVNGLFSFENGNIAMQSWTTQYKPYKLDESGNIELMPFTPLGMDNLLVNPCVMNDICTANYDGSWENDHFLINLFNDVRMMANMSIDGENF